MSQNRIAYTASLTLLFTILLVALNFPDFIFSQVWLPLVAIGSSLALMATSRKYGRLLMRNEHYDSIWEFRWFFLAFWVLMMIASVAIGVIRSSNADLAWSVFVGLIVTLNIGGIIIHAKTRKKLVKNIKKEELFQ